MEYPPVQIMNAGTIGGSISSSCPFFDLPVALLALDCTVQVEGVTGQRTVPLREFFTGLFENALDSREFVTGVNIPVPSVPSTSAFIKMETNANDLAILNVAVSLGMSGAGKCEIARVFIGGGVGETPVRSHLAEQVLLGTSLDEDTYTKAGDAVTGDLYPIDDHRASAAYRKAMSKVLLQRALRRAVERLY